MALSPSMALDLQAQPWVLWVSLAFASVYIVQTIKHHTTHRLPPGPRGIPFLGPLFQLSATPWKEFETWKAQYGKSTPLLNGSVHPQFDRGSGPLLFMSIAGQKILVLNTNKVAADLLDRRGGTYSDRPRFISMSCHQCLQHSVPTESLRSSGGRDIYGRVDVIPGEIR